MSRVTLAGGSVTAIPGVASTPFLAFAPDGTIWFSTLPGGILQITADGKVTPRFSGDTLPKPMAIQQVLANGKEAIVKEIQNSDGIPYFMDLRTGALTQIIDVTVAEIRYAAGYLVMARNDGRLEAMPYDIDKRKPTAAAVQIAGDVALSGSGIAQFAVAQNGNITYLPAQPRELMLVDRNGSPRALTSEKHSFHEPRFSPDGSTILFDFTTVDGRDIWKLDRASSSITRVTSAHDGHDGSWSVDGRSILYASVRNGVYGIYRMRMGSGVGELWHASNKFTWPGRFMPDGKSILTVGNEMTAGSGNDIIMVDSAGHITTVFSTPRAEQWPDVSPDGKWLAYVSDVTGVAEVYVRAVSGGSDQAQVSLAGGTEPMWSKDGHELFYRAAGGGHTTLTSATLGMAPALGVTSRKPLFQVDEYDTAQPHSNYDISPDGKYFVMVHRGPIGRIVVIQNLPALVRRLQRAAGK
jgi:Tol biopolymer transport system component